MNRITLKIKLKLKTSEDNPYLIKCAPLGKKSSFSFNCSKAFNSTSMFSSNFWRILYRNSY